MYSARPSMQVGPVIAGQLYALCDPTAVVALTLDQMVTV